MRDGNLVLIVDADAAVRHALQFALRQEGLCARAHPTGAAMLDDPQLGEAVCIVIDEDSHRRAEWALLAMLRQRGSAAPVLLLASRADPAARRRAADEGIAAVLEKPLLDSALADAIQATLRIIP